MEAFAADAETAPAELPADALEAALFARPIRSAGSAPRAGVILIDIDVQGAEAA